MLLTLGSPMRKKTWYKEHKADIDGFWKCFIDLAFCVDEYSTILDDPDLADKFFDMADFGYDLLYNNAAVTEQRLVNILALIKTLDLIKAFSSTSTTKTVTPDVDPTNFMKYWQAQVCHWIVARPDSRN